MPSLSPPVCRGNIATKPNLLMLASGLMFGVDLLLAIFCEIPLFGTFFSQLAVMVAILLLSARRWVAIALLCIAGVAHALWCGAWSYGALIFLIPLWVGTMVAFPVRRVRNKGE